MSERLAPDLAAIFAVVPGVSLLLAADPPRFTMLAASDERLAATHTTRDETIGRPLFEVFSDGNPENPEASGVTNLRTSLESVLRTRTAHRMAVQRYDVQRPDGTWEVRHWAPRNIPVLGPDGGVRYLLHHVEDVTDSVRRGEAHDRLRDEFVESEDARRALETANARLNEQQLALERANARLHEQALELEAQSGKLQAALARLEEREKEGEEERSRVTRSEAKYRALFESIDEGFAVIEVRFDAGGRAVDYHFVETNSAFEQQTGLVGAVGRNVRELVPGIEEHWIELYGRVASTGEPTRLQNGSEAMGRWFDVFAFRLGRAEEHTVAVLFTDVSAKHVAERERERLLRELELERSRLAYVFQRAPSFLAILRGRDFVFTLANDAYYQLVGHRSLLGKPVWEALPEVRGQGFETLLNGVVDTGEPFIGREVPVRVQRVPGAPDEERFVDLAYLPLVEADGARVGIIAHGSDVTEQVLARREAERARDRANRLQSLTAALAAATTPEDIASVVVAQGFQATGAASGALILRADDRDDEVVIVRQSGLSGDMLARYTRFPRSANSPSTRCMRTGDPIFLASPETLQTEFPEQAFAWKSLATQSLACVPLTHAGEPVGAMTFTFTERRDFPPEDREFFLALGRQATQALERARLFESERTARVRTEGLQRVTATLAEARTMADVGRVFSRELMALIGADTTWVGVVSPDDTAIEALGWAGYTEELATRWQRLPLDAGIALTDAVRTAQPQWWPTREALAGAYPERATMIRAMAQDGVAVLPILGDGDAAAGRAIGGIVVGFRTAQRFDADTRAFLLALAQQCAQAVARARAYEAERSARLEAEDARRSAESANRAKSDFLATMSHELRTPLNAIGGYAELIELGVRGPVTADQRADLERIQRAQRHLLGLINGVLNYAKVDAGAVHYEVTDVTLDEVLATCESLVTPQAHAKRIALVREPSDASLVVRADREKMQQVVLNLLSNAVKFTDPGGRVTLASEGAAHHQAIVRVTDTGHGIAGDHLERVFQPFVQIDSTLTRTQEGTGLGLAISRDLARGMNGDLTVESTPGVGSSFSLVLPRA